MSKKLYRSRVNKVIAGVCGGMGKHFGIDPIIFRFIFLGLLLAGGSSILIYVILIIVIPRDIRTNDVALDTYNISASIVNDDQEYGSSRLIIGLVLITSGILFLLNNLVPDMKLEKIWPAILIIIGLGLVFQKKQTEPETNIQDDTKNDSTVI